MRNRKLLVSVQSAYEAREAIAGGGRIIDSEDPKTALGNIPPKQIMDIARAVLDAKRDLGVQLSTNIGEDQLLFRKASNGHAIMKTNAEMAGKAAQAALGVVSSMGTRVHPSPVVKVGVDGMTLEEAKLVLSTVASSLARSESYSDTRVMAAFFVHDLDTWDKRKDNDAVVRALVAAGEFQPVADGKVVEKYVESLTGEKKERAMRLAPCVRVNEPVPHSVFLGGRSEQHRRTDATVLQAMVDCAADAGAHGIMIDTSILMKAANICLFDTSRNDNLGVVDLNKFVIVDALEQRGVLALEELRFFVEYSRLRGLVTNLAGSIASHHAQQLWALLPDVDQLSTRGAASAVQRSPVSGSHEGTDTRLARVIHRNLVQGMAPPEQGGVLNVPRDRLGKALDVNEAFAKAAAVARQASGGDLEIRDVDRYGDVRTFAGG